MTGNPFSMSFGLMPLHYIQRPVETDYIISTFTSEYPSDRAFMISGIRGSGKTVFMNSLANHFESKKEWIVIKLNPTRDILESFARKLFAAAKTKMKSIDIDSVGFSLFGFGASVNTSRKMEMDVEDAIEEILKKLKEKGMRVLVTIDEVSGTREMAIFAHAFQIFIGEDDLCPLFLLMTGVYNNINKLKNKKDLTFLYRARRVSMGPLSLTDIRDSYQDVLQIDADEAAKYAKLTKGYSLAYQCLGSILWEQKDITAAAAAKLFDRMMSQYAYEKIWSELSDVDQNILNIIVNNGKTSMKMREIREALHVSPQYLNQYKRRLVERGIIQNTSQNVIRIILPRFEKYVEELAILGD